MTREIIELGQKLLKLSDQDIRRLCSGGYGELKQREFFRELNKVLEEVAGAKRAFHLKW